MGNISNILKYCARNPPPLTNISCEVDLVISKYRFELLPWLSGMSGVVNIRLLMINPWYTQNIQIVQDISNIQIVQDISNCVDAI